jgi:type I restriction enzyme S subunit
MNAERLLEVYEQISEAPDAIARLRRFVLDLAARGKLVEQDAADEPASQLLDDFAEAKADLAKRKVIRKPKALEPISASESLSFTPSSWATQRLGSLCTVITKGSTPTSYGREFTQSGVNFLKVESIKNGRVDASSISAFISSDTHEFLSRSQLETGDILFSIAGSIGTCAVVSADILPANTNQALAIIRGTSQIFAPDFLILLLRSFVSDAVKNKARGGAMNNVSLTDLQNLVLPVPPLAEQHRIIAKVDELMALCDRLAEARKTREETRDKLTAASLARLTAPDTAAEDFPAHANFALEALPALTTRPDQIKTLRQTILNLAVRGKLVEQDPADEPADLLQARMQEAREILMKEKGARKKKPVAPLEDIELLRLPTAWTADAFANLIDPKATISYGVLVPGPEVDDGVPFVRAQDLALSGHPDRPNKSIAHDIEAKYSRTRLLGGEILLCVVGSIGKLGIAPQKWAGANIARAVARIAPMPEIEREYLLLFLRSDLAQKYFEEATRTLAQPTLNVGLLERLPVPIPPLAEQHRIVAKVDALMALCDRLEAALTTTDTTRTRLLEALLHEALEPSQNVMEAAE